MTVEEFAVIVFTIFYITPLGLNLIFGAHRIWVRYHRWGQITIGDLTKLIVIPFVPIMNLFLTIFNLIEIYEQYESTAIFKRNGKK
jgi:hypothetical protein